MGLWQSVPSAPGAEGRSGDAGDGGGAGSFDICISGAGIAGLALARRLEQLGFRSVCIFEADDSLQRRPQGYSLTIQEPGRKALGALGLLHVVREGSRWGGGGQYLVNARDGSLLRSMGPPKPKPKPLEPLAPGAPGAPGARSRTRNFYVPRQQLRSVLAGSLASTEILWSQRIESYREAGGMVDVTLSSGKRVSTSLLVGCDGIHSAVRSGKLGDALRYLGVGMINGIVESGPALCSAGSLQLLDGRTRLFMKPFATGERAMWQLSFPADLGEVEQLRAASKEELHARAVQETSAWHPKYQAILRDTGLPTLRGGGLFDRDPLRCAEHPMGGRVALIGDAAHPMSPFIGQGANQALADAIQLAEALSHCRNAAGRLELSSLDETLASFHASMARRVAPRVLESRRRVEISHTPAILGKQ